jgi:hypothetical protein
MTAITLPPTGIHPDEFVCRSDTQLRARDLEVARLVLESAANFCTDEYHTPDGWGTTTADRRCAAGILKLEVKHHE